MAHLIKGDTQRLRDAAPILDAEVASVYQLLWRCPADVWAKGAAWYPDLNTWARQLAAQTGYTVREVADVIAIYSVNNQWTSNLPTAKRALLDPTYRRGLVNPATGFNAGQLVRMVLDHGKTLDQALRAVHLADCYPKPRMFSRSIQLLDSVTVDRYIYALFGKPQTPAWYVWVAQRMAYVAQLFGLRPFIGQAIAWMADAFRRGDNLNNFVAIR